MTLSKHKFLLLGILLALLIGAGLGVLNHFVREENKFQEAEMEQSARVKAIPQLAPTANGLGAPTRMAQPAQ